MPGFLNFSLLTQQSTQVSPSGMKVGIGFHSLLIQLLGRTDVPLLMLAARLLKKRGPNVGGMAEIVAVC